MMLTASSFDGEALTAIRKANAMLAAEKLNWEEYLSGKGASKSSGFKPPPKRTDQFGKTKADWDEIIDAVNREVRGKARDFIESIADQWWANGRLTPAQKSAILKFYNNL